MAAKATLPKRPASAKGRGVALEVRAPHSRVMPSGPYALDSAEFKTKGSSWKAIQMGYSMWKPKVGATSPLSARIGVLSSVGDETHRDCGQTWVCFLVTVGGSLSLLIYC